MSLGGILPVGNEYPYMYARVSARRAKLLEREDYEDLVKMKPNEIANRLEELDYTREIEELGASYSGAELVELAVNRNLARTMSKLIDIAPEEVEEVLEIFLRRYDIETIKRILRWKKNGSKQDIYSLMVPVSRYTFEEMEKLIEKDYRQIVEEIKFSESRVNYRKYIEEAGTLKGIENALDAAYHEEITELGEKINSSQFRKFIIYETDNENLMKVLRLKKAGLEDKQIREELPDKFSKLVEEVLEAGTVEEAVEKLVEEGRAEEREGLEEVEQSMKKKRLQRALRTFHTEPLGITSILGYVVAKIVEAENLRTLAQAREAGVEKEELMDNLVIA